MLARRDRRDHTPVAVVVPAGTAVYFAGEHRTGELAAVPRHLAEHWARHGWAVITSPLNSTNTPPSTPTPPRAKGRTPCRSVKKAPYGLGNSRADGAEPATERPNTLVYNDVRDSGTSGDQAEEAAIAADLAYLVALERHESREQRYETQPERYETRPLESCPECGGPLPPPKSGRPRLTCSNACKSKAARRRRRSQA